MLQNYHTPWSPVVIVDTEAERDQLSHKFDKMIAFVREDESLFWWDSSGGTWKEFSGGNLNGVVKETTAATTYYVKEDGSDDADGLTESSAFATIQKAVGIIPRVVKHQVVVNVGAGSFAGFKLDGFQIMSGGSVKVRGALVGFTPTTGPETGTATGGSATKIVDSSAAWTPDELIGKMALVGGEYRFIIDNDATSIDVQGAYSGSTSGKAYSLKDLGTLLNAQASGTMYARIEAVANTAISYGQLEGNEWFSVENFKVDGSSCWWDAFWGWMGMCPDLRRIYAFDTYWGIGAQNIHARCYWEDLWVEGGYGAPLAPIYLMEFVEARVSRAVVRNTIAGSGIDIRIGFYAALADILSMDNNKSGVYIAYTNTLGIDNVVCTGNGDYGIEAWSSTLDFNLGIACSGNGKDGIAIYGCPYTDLDSLVCENNTGVGLRLGSRDKIDGNACNLATGGYVGIATAVFNGNSHGIVADWGVNLFLKDVEGSGNTGYGIVCGSDVHVILTSETEVTGTSGDIQIGGEVGLGYSADFSSDGDVVVDLTNGCRVERKDIS